MYNGHITDSIIYQLRCINNNVELLSDTKKKFNNDTIYTSIQANIHNIEHYAKYG